MSPISSERHRAEELRNLHTKFSVARSSWIFFFLRAKSHEKWSSSLEDPTIFLYSFYRICQSEIIKREKEKKTFLSFRLNRKKELYFPCDTHAFRLLLLHQYVRQLRMHHSFPPEMKWASVRLSGGKTKTLKCLSLATTDVSSVASDSFAYVGGIYG